MALCLALGACAPGDGGRPSSPPPSSASPDRFGAPEVTNPLSVRVVAEAPCARLLTSQDLRSLRIASDGSARSYYGVAECSWVNDADDRLSIGVVADRDLLVDTYRAARTPIFEPVVVAGYPAVRQRTSLDYNTCTVTTGVGPQQALETDWTGHLAPSPDVDPCERAEEAIALVIRKLPPQR